MRRKVYLLVFDGLADWEPALALCEINKSGKYEVVTVGFSTKPVKTMGGCTLIPDIGMESLILAETALCILPGGEMWEQGVPAEVLRLLQQFQANGTPLAAICGATLAVARAGLTHGLRHTSNSIGYLKAMLADYADDDFYVDKLAVADRNLITASGLGSVEFACEIVRVLNIYSSEEIEELYGMFKHGLIPARYAS